MGGADRDLGAQRQKELVRQFYVEVAALEEVLEESVYALGTDARTILIQVVPASICRPHARCSVMCPAAADPPRITAAWICTQK